MIVVVACIVAFILLYFVTGALERWRSTFVMLALSLLLFAPTAQAQTPSGGIFAAQCHAIDSATVHQFARNTNSDGTLYAERSSSIRNLNELATLQYAPGVWHDYNSATPFGGTYPDTTRGYWRWILVTQTPCGEFQTWAWDNGDSSLIVFAFYNLQSNCDANGQHCGSHNFEFYYVTVAEWQRVTRR